MSYHVPVLLHESIEGLNINPEGIYVDVTFGGGGHSREILSRLTTGKLLAFDQDADAEKNIIKQENFIFCNSNFRFLRNFLKYYNAPQIDGLLADLGVSSHHFDEVSRGFTFQHDAPLDMRMNPDSPVTAADILMNAAENELRYIFREYGEVENTGKLVNLIVNSRLNTKIDTSSKFIEAIKPAIPRNQENKYLAKVYQALRIRVNNELESLKALLTQCIGAIKPGGRLVVITYHSLEDRLVKNFIKNGIFEGEAESDLFGNRQVPFRNVYNKIITPSENELSINSRARSAKLRVAERI
ncbi:MAG TPA: 16S rRNA (cytosine(1402)-N(4))-methyltransferase RsmH [Bacteroidales bacterium]|nr:16S rRNA (cytosine(1402)-N(4))-methyltransferase RsmH [Bacteroidales bacterium]